MAAEKIDVGHVAQLARITLDDNSKGRFQENIESILEYVEKLSELDVDGIEPTAHATPLTNVLRDDVKKESFSRDVMLSNAPATIDDELIAVPPVLPGEESS